MSDVREAAQELVDLICPRVGADGDPMNYIEPANKLRLALTASPERAAISPSPSAEIFALAQAAAEHQAKPMTESVEAWAQRIAKQVCSPEPSGPEMFEAGVRWMSDYADSVFSMEDMRAGYELYTHNRLTTQEEDEEDDAIDEDTRDERRESQRRRNCPPCH